MSNRKLCFAMIGSGRVASHLAPALVKGGLECAAVYSPTYSHAEALANKIKSNAVTTIQMIVDSEVDFVLLSIKDDALWDVVEHFPNAHPTPLIHTSGSTTIKVLDKVKHYGVLYPMQTFSKERKIDIKEVPFFTEASDDTIDQLLKEITYHIGAKEVHPLSSENRGRLHLASVFACNFTNHLYTISDQVLEEIGLDFSILRTLIYETIEKAVMNHPIDVQTGPALRGDQKTIQYHLELLEKHTDYQEIYKLISQSIYKQHHE